MMWFFVPIATIIGFSIFLDWQKNKTVNSPHRLNHPDNSSESSTHYYSGESSSSDGGSDGGGGGGGDC